MNNPQVTFGSYQATSAQYKSQRGLHLAVAFEPGDSNSAEIFCGRAWEADQFWSLSANYALVAEKVGLNVPKYYRLNYGDEADKTIRQMFADLQMSLPRVESVISLDDLVQLERRYAGAEARAMSHLGDGYLSLVKISEFAESDLLSTPPS